MRVWVMCLVVSLLAGCSLAPKYERPSMDLPETWTTGAKQGEDLEVQWWKRFADPALNTLIQDALVYNKDIEAAAARVDYARAQLGLARAEQFPILNGQAQAAPVWVDNKQVQSGTPFQAGFSASWELDLWGKLRNAKEAALYQMMASEAARQGVWLSIAGQTANAYFLLRGLDLQQNIAERTLKTRESALNIYTARYEQGLINELDLMRAKTEVETAQTALYRTRLARDAAESALSVLIGRSPRDIMAGTIDRGTDLEHLPTAPVIPAGVPSALLERRPDIRQAEYVLQASNATIGVAKAAWLPNLSLTGMFGAVSLELHNLIKNPMEAWSYGGAITVPLLDFGRIQAGVESAEAKQREAIALYGKTIQTSFRDMRDALTQQAEYARIVQSLEKMVTELRTAVELARARYDNGYSAYLEVLDAERSLFDSELNLASARKDRLTAIVNVCLALGGGWK